MTCIARNILYNIINIPLVGVVGFLLHHLQYSFACISAILWIAINGNSLLQRANIVLTVDINSGAALLCNEADGAPLATYDGADHIALHQQSQREVSGPRAATGGAAAATAATRASAPTTASVLLSRLNFQPTTFQLASIQSIDCSVTTYCVLVISLHTYFTKQHP